MPHASIRRVAHDPGDPLIVSHCPLCGSGQVVGLSDGSIQCEFCGGVFLVRIQPAYPGMPQGPLGPGAPSDVMPDMANAMGPEMGPDGEPLPPGAEDEGAPPFPPGEEDDAGEEPFPPGGDEDEGAPPEEESDDEDGGEEKPPPFLKSKKKGARTAGLRANTPENRRHYRRGWDASVRAGWSENPDNDPLGRADSRGEHEAWYDGYMDDATGRPKYHSLECPASEHERDPACTLNQRQASYRTVAGDELPEDAYIRHLAVLHGGTGVLRRVAS